MAFDTIQINHSKYGELNCRIIGLDNGIKTIWCQPLPEYMHYDDSTETIRYFYTVQSAIKTWENNGIYGTVDKNSLRYDNIKMYGCNQWPICPLRSYLNSEFLEGFSEEFRSRIVPTENEICISRVSAKTEEDVSHENEQIVSDKEQFRITSKKGNGMRITIARTIDKVYLPSIMLLSKIANTDENRVFAGIDGKLRYYWLMDPTPAMNDEFSVNSITQYYDESRDKYTTYQVLANANSMNITAAPIMRIKD